MADFIPQPQRFLDTAEKMGEAPAYAIRGVDGWENTSWADAVQLAQSVAAGMIDAGVERGDRICIISFNRPEWVMSYLGAMLIGAVPVGIYWTASDKDIQYIVNHSEAKAVFVENTEQARKVDAVLAECPTLKHRIIFDEDDTLNGYTSWEVFTSRLGATHISRITDALVQIAPEDCGTLIYTSGTTGPPKAVFLSQRALISAAQAVISMFEPTPEDRLISYLPMAHIAEQNGMIHQWVQTGFKVYFAKSIEAVPEHLPEVRPTIYFGVPRVFEKMVAALSERIEAAAPPARVIMKWALNAGRKGHLAALNEQALGFLDQLQFNIAEKFLLSKIRARIGLDRARYFVCGAAPLSMDVLETCASLGLIIREVYGQSETGGPTTVNIPGATRFGSVGKPPSSISVRIAEDEEILVRGDNLFSGYDRDEDATNVSLKDGWLHSGDLGRLDEDGYLYITGRKKDLIITSGGKNISPAYIEADLMDTPIIEHAVIAGDNRHYLVALITINRDSSLLDGKTSADIEQMIEKAVQGVNDSHSRAEHIRKFKILDTAFTPDSGELTSTLKVRRHTVLDKYAVEVEALYDEALQDTAMIA